MLPRFYLFRLQAFKLQTVETIKAVKTVQHLLIHKAVLGCVAVLLILNGCATNQPYGSFIQNPSPAFNQYSEVMAADVADQIGRLYPAATTLFNLRHNASDPFGQALIDNLRIRGYAVKESTEQENPLLAVVRSEQNSDTDEYAPQIAQTGAKPGLALGYIVDQSDDLYHINILIEDLILTRAFVTQSEQIEPAGLWVRRQLKD